jgi:hypothetical protein
MLAGKAQARADRMAAMQVFERFLQVCVNYNKVKLMHMAHFAQGRGHAALNHLFGVLPAPAQAAFQFANRRRQDEDADGLTETGVSPAVRPASRFPASGRDCSARSACSSAEA